MSGNFRGYLIKELLDFDDERNPVTSPYDIVYPVTLTDAIFDKLGDSSDRKSLTTILNEIWEAIEEGPKNWKIDFPVNSVNGQTGVVKLTKKDFADLNKVDNTPDIEKIVSEPQKDFIEDRLSYRLNEFDNETVKPFKDDFRDHINNHNNPHSVSLDDINEGNRLTNFINNYIGTHNNASDAHANILNPIRNDIRNMKQATDDDRESLSRLSDDFVRHSNIGGTDHGKIFASKENIANRVETLIKSPYNENNGVEVIPGTVSTDKYPSTHAMVEYFQSYYKEAIKSVTLNGLEYVKRISAVNTDVELKRITPSEDQKGIAYIIGELTEGFYKGHVGLGICVEQDSINGKIWHWQTSPLFRQVMLDTKYFELDNTTKRWTFKKDADILTSIKFNWTRIDTDKSWNLSYNINGESNATDIFKLNDFAVEKDNSNKAYTRLAQRLLDTGELDVLKFSYKAVTKLPNVNDADPSKIYLLKDRTSGDNDESNTHTEYIVVTNEDGTKTWEAIGTTQMEFDNFVKKDKVITADDVDTMCVSLGITPKPAA